jgi:hypothetical protein
VEKEPVIMEDDRGLRAAAGRAIFPAPLAFSIPSLTHVSIDDQPRFSPTIKVFLMHFDPGLRRHGASPADINSIFIEPFPHFKS